MSAKIRYTGPVCERCGTHTDDVSDTEIGVLCWDCLDGQAQADADRANDEARDWATEQGD